MEKDVKILTSDKKVIHGTLTASVPRSKKLIIFVHGLTGHRNEHTFFNAAHYFSKKGYNIFRFDLYGEGRKARNFYDTSLTIHGNDTRVVFDYFKKRGFTKVFLVGHSYGGPTTLLSRAPATAVVWWDPSFDVASIYREKEVWKDSKSGMRFIDWGIPMLVSDTYIRDAKKLTPKKTLRLVNQWKVPLKIIAAEKGVLVPGAKRYLSHAHEPKELAIVPNAGHNFNEEGTEQVLFSETLNWIRKFS